MTIADFNSWYSEKNVYELGSFNFIESCAKLMLYENWTGITNLLTLENVWIYDQSYIQASIFIANCINYLNVLNCKKSLKK